MKGVGGGVAARAWSPETVITLCDGGKLLGSFRLLVFHPSAATFALPPSLVAQRENSLCLISVSLCYFTPLPEMFCLCLFHTGMTRRPREACSLKTEANECIL